MIRNLMILSAIYLAILAGTDFLAQPAQAQTPGVWQVNGPEFNAEITGIIVDPDDYRRIHVGTRGRVNVVNPGLFRTLNGGISWSIAPAPLDKSTIESIYWINSTLYASAYNYTDSLSSGVYLSYDRGDSWNRAAAPLHDKILTAMLDVNGVLYAGVVTLNNEEEEVRSALGVFRSIDGGNSWEQLLDLDGLMVTRLAVDTSTGRLFAGTSTYMGYNGVVSYLNVAPQGVYVSNDGGDSWTQANPPLNNEYVESLLVYDGTAYLGTYFSGMFTSTDGIDWTPAPAPLDSGRVRNVIVALDTMFASRNNIVYRSLDAGNTWEQNITATKPVTVLMSDGHPTVPYLYFGTDGNGAYQSRDVGRNWEQGSAPMDSSRVTVLVPDGGAIETYAGTSNNGIWRSPNGGGAVWLPTAKYKTNLPTVSILVQDRTVMAYGLGGVFRSENAGETWSAANTNMNHSDRLVSKLAFYRPSQSYFAALLNGKNNDPHDIGVWQSQDGINWEKTALDSVQLFSVLVNWLGNIYAAGDGIYYSVDGGDTWNQSNGLPGGIIVNYLLEGSDDAIYAASSEGLYYSTDGVNWQQAGGEIGNQNLYTLYEANGVYYAGSEFSGLFSSPDGRNNWVQASPPLNDKQVTQIVSADVGGTTFLLAGTGGESSSPADAQGIFFSSDSGATWQQADLPGNDLREIRSLLTVTDNTSEVTAVFASIDQYGVARSLDGGQTWRPLITGLSDVNTTGLSYLDISNRLFLATFKGVFVQDLDFTNPEAFFLYVEGSNNYYTQRDSVRIFLDALGADSMLISEDLELVQDGSSGWEEFNEIKRTYYLDKLEGTRRVYARFKDYSWNLSEVIVDSVVLDTTRPAFPTHTPPPSPTLTQEDFIYFTQQIDEPNLDEMELRYRRQGEKFTLNNTSFFFNDTAYVDYFDISNRGLDYRIVAQDLAKNADTLVNQVLGNGQRLTFFSLPITLQPNELGNSPGLPGGTTGASYRMVSIPMQLNGAQAFQSVFGDFGKYGKQGEWRLWNFTGGGQWQEGENLTLQAGSALFLILRDTKRLTNQIAGSTMPTTAGVLGEVPGWELRANDWTLIGNPYNTRIELKQLKLQNGGSRLSDQDSLVQVWAYDGSWKQDNIALEPWSGLFVWSAAADRIVFTSVNDPFNSDLQKVIAPANARSGEVAGENDWTVSIRAEQNGFVDDSNIFGVRQDAAEVLDNRDRRELPMLPGGIRITFPHPEWQRPALLTADLRAPEAPGYRWDLEVSGEPGSVLALNFHDVESVPADFGIMLLETNSGMVRDLREQREIELRIGSNGQSALLAVLAGNSEYLNRALNGLSTIPESFALQQNYPNPFNPATTIRYQMPVAGKVTLKVYDVLGRSVLTIENDRQRKAGYYESVADMSRFASGVYFYRLTIDGEQRFQAVKKMLLVK